MSEDDVKHALKQPWVMVSSDGSAVPYKGETYGGTLGFGKWGFDRAWRSMCWNNLKVDPTSGGLKRTSYPPEVDDIINSLRYEETRNLNWIVLADHCTGIQWG